MTTATTAEPAAAPAAEHALAAAFDSKPNPGRFRLFGATKQAHDVLRMALKAGRALSLLVGHDGVGKSTLMQRLGEELGGREALSIYLPNSHMALDDVLRACCEGMGVPAAADTRNARLAAIARYAGDVNRRAIMFFVDNAHTYSNAALLDFAALSAFDTGTPVVYQVVLAGPPSLEEYLEVNLQQVRGRVSAIVHMAPLDLDDVEAYIRFRLEAASGTGGGDVLTSELVERIARKSYGVPGLINELCAFALTHPIEEVLARLEPDPPPVDVEIEDSAEIVNDHPTGAIETPSADAQGDAEPASAMQPESHASAPSEAPPRPSDSTGAPALELEAERPSDPIEVARSTDSPAPQREADIAPPTAVEQRPAAIIEPATAPEPVAIAEPMATPEPVAAAPPPPVQRAADPADVVASLPPPETPSAAASATATTPGAESSRVARAPDQASEPGDSEVGPLEQPATILIDDTPDIEPPPARVDTETPKRRFSFRVNEGADVKKPQTYEEWRRQAEEERRREGNADPRFEYVPQESSPATPRVLIPTSADDRTQAGAPPVAALDNPTPGAVPWVAAVESALMRAASRRTADNTIEPAALGEASAAPSVAAQVPAERKPASGLDAPKMEKPPQDRPAKKRRFGFF